MFLAVDTCYREAGTNTAGLSFRDWSDAEPLAVYTQEGKAAAPYMPGAFYRRELPCILHLLQQPEVPLPAVLIIDGYVYTDDAGKPGLGAYLYEALRGAVPVIGIAKTKFAAVDRKQREVRRGGSVRPLYVTAIGMDPDEAAAGVARMHGPYRIPTLLKQLDRITRA
ncbi:MAG TPA: endonuclease V [Chitinophagaceae bacterium]|jgi:exodeoxyribonuclease-5/deoxyribonuclease V|nr:endonuclease V [Chitinophagaceae bacterium]